MFGSCCVEANEKNKYKTYQQLIRALHEAGLESSQLIFGFDFSASNKWTGDRSYHCNMHDVERLRVTPYEEITQLMKPMVEQFDEDGMLPCYVFGDVLTKNARVRPLVPGAQTPYIQGLDNVILAYRQYAPLI